MTFLPLKSGRAGRESPERQVKATACPVRSAGDQPAVPMPALYAKAADQSARPLSSYQETPRGRFPSPLICSARPGKARSTIGDLARLQSGPHSSSVDYHGGWPLDLRVEPGCVRCGDLGHEADYAVNERRQATGGASAIILAVFVEQKSCRWRWSTACIPLYDCRASAMLRRLAARIDDEPAAAWRVFDKNY